MLATICSSKYQQTSTSLSVQGLTHRPVTVFGAVFSALAYVNEAHLIFIVNGGLAFVAGVVTLFISMPKTIAVG